MNLIKDRRALHSIPEFGMELPNTQAFLLSRIREMGLEPTQVGSGLIVDLGEKGPRIAWRADMDGLPIQEETGLAYASRHPGLMHACGHDVHMAIALGVVEHFSKAILPGFRLRVIFQPGEEGHGGADFMIEHGALEEVKNIFGLHVRSSNEEIPIGGFGTKSREFMAASEKFRFDFVGSGGHGATPHQNLDAISSACQFILSVNGLKARLDTLRPIALSFGMIHGGLTCNTMPERVAVEGTYRFFGEDLREKLEGIASAVTNIYGTGFESIITNISSEVYNEPELVEFLGSSIKECGEDFTLLRGIYMGGEDFSSYQEQIPGVFFYFNAGPENKDRVFPLHHGKFNIDERLLPRAVKVAVNLIDRWGIRASVESD